MFIIVFMLKIEKKFSATSLKQANIG